MGSDDAVKREEPAPDEGIKRGQAAPDDKDTEGHKRDAEPDGAADDGKGEAPGPDDAHFSDRKLKVGIVPVEW